MRSNSQSQLLSLEVMVAQRAPNSQCALRLLRWIGGGWRAVTPREGKGIAWLRVVLFDCAMRSSCSEAGRPQFHPAYDDSVERLLATTGGIDLSGTESTLRSRAVWFSGWEGSFRNLPARKTEWMWRVLTWRFGCMQLIRDASFGCCESLCANHRRYPSQAWIQPRRLPRRCRAIGQ